MLENAESCGMVHIKQSTELRPRKVDLLSNAGFKAVFGDQNNKQVLIDFLNSVLPRGRKVKDLTYATTEFAGATLENRGVVLDLRCEDEDGTTFIVEMQRYRQDHFAERCMMYASRVYDSRSREEIVNFKIPPVYLVAILATDDFDRSHPTWKDRYVSVHSMREDTSHELLNESISIIFVELKRFNKPLEECNSLQDKWCFALKHMSRLEALPEKLQTDIFRRLFEAAEIAEFSIEKRQQYDKDMITERDWENIKSTARREGREEGRLEGREEGRREGRAEERLAVAKNFKSLGISFADIAKATGLTMEEIEEL